MASVVDYRERGSVIFIILVTVALFGALTYAFLQGTRGNIEWLKAEESKATQTGTAQCSLMVTAAERRLAARGCAGKISYASSGENIKAGAPTDGSCSIYHPKGGGVQPCPDYVEPPCDKTDLAVGQLGCGVVYAGIADGRRIYAYPTDSMGRTPMSATGGGPNIAGGTDGLINTNTLVSATWHGAYPFIGAEKCRSLGPDWYLPSISELSLLNSVKNVGAFAGTFSTCSCGNVGFQQTSWYWSSHQMFTNANHRFYSFDAGSAGQTLTTSSPGFRVRCVRRD